MSDPMAEPNDQDYKAQAERKRLEMELGKPGRPEHPVAKSLRELGVIFDDRAAVYGDNYKHFGTVMIGMFPRGLTLRTADDFNRFSLFALSVVKQTRYAQMFERGGHRDSLDDSSVYNQMLAEVDDIIREKKP